MDERVNMTSGDQSRNTTSTNKVKFMILLCATILLLNSIILKPVSTLSYNVEAGDIFRWQFSKVEGPAVTEEVLTKIQLPVYSQMVGAEINGTLVDWMESYTIGYLEEVNITIYLHLPQEEFFCVIMTPRDNVTCGLDSYIFDFPFITPVETNYSQYPSSYSFNNIGVLLSASRQVTIQNQSYSCTLTLVTKKTLSPFPANILIFTLCCAILIVLIIRKKQIL